MKQLCILLSFISLFSIQAQEIEVTNNEITLHRALRDTLSTLDLSNRGLTQIPTNLASFPALRKLNLSNNNIRTAQGLKALKKLEELILNGNKNLVPASLNGEIESLGRLKKLNIEACEMLYIPYAVYNLPELTNLNLSNNNIELVSFEIQKLKQLETLNLSNNRINFIDNGVIALRELKMLDISGNRLENLPHLFFQLESLNQLNSLAIDYELTEEEVLSGFQFSTLKNLALKHCSQYLNGDFLSGFQAVRQLSLSGNISALESSLIIKNFKTDSLKKLSLNSAVLEELPSVINELTALEALELNTPGLELSTALNRMSTLEIKELSLFYPGLKKLPVSVSVLNSLERVFLESFELKELPLELTLLTNLNKVQILTAETKVKNLQTLRREMPDCEFILNSKTLKIKNGLTPPLASADIPFREYVVDAEKGRKIQSATGTEIIIPSAAFLNKNGEEVKGNVRILYREFNDPIDMAFAGIPMSETENGVTYRYESAGMMEFRAFQQNEELKANPQNLVQVNYNSPFRGSEYDLYYLEPETAKWKNVGKDSLGQKTENIQQEAVELPELPERPVYPSMPYNKSKVKFHMGKLNLKKRSGKVPEIWVTSDSRKNRRDTLNKVFSEMKYFNRVKWKLDAGFDDKNKSKETEELFEEINMKMAGGSRLSRNSKKSTIEWGQISYIDDFWIKPNKKNDNFDLILSKSGELMTFPILPDNLPARAESAQRKIKSFYKNYYKNLMKRKADWEKVDLHYADKMLVYEKEMEVYSKEIKLYIQEMEKFSSEELEELKMYAATESTIVRSFTLMNFGMFNCDIRNRMEQPVKILASLVNEDGEELEIEKLYVLDLEANGLLTFNNYEEAFFDRKHTNSLIAILKNEEVAILKSDAFNAASISKKSNFASLKVYNMKKTTLGELRKSAAFF